MRTVRPVEPRLLALGLCLLMAGLAGCRGTPAYQGSQRDVMATFRFRRLSADLPPTVRVPAAVAASKAALLSRGYTVTSATATEDTGHVEAVPADAGFLESISVDIRETASATRVQIIAEPIGSQTRSRLILDSILTNLGL